MAKKKKVYDTSLIDGIRQRTAMYDAMIAPQINTEEYMHRMANPDANYEEAPDNYGFTDWASNAFYDWNLTKAQTERDAKLGEYIMADQDYNTLISLKDYINSSKAVIELSRQLSQDPTNEQLKQQLQEASLMQVNNKSAYDTAISGKFNNNYLNSYITGSLKQGNLDNTLIEIDKEINPITRPDGSMQDDNIYNKRIVSLRDAEIQSDKAKRFDEKLTSQYYRKNKEKSGMDFSDIDTWLFKLPGLLGSSAASVGSSILGTLSAYYAASAGNPLVAGAAALVSIGSNLYSRDQESKSEVFQNYKQSVKNSAKKLGVDEDVLADAKIKMAQQGYSTEQINDDEYVYDRILSGDIKINNRKFNKAMLDNREGLRSLYIDNMALSISDVAQQAIEVVPIGSVAKKVKGLKTLAEKGAKLRKGLQEQLSNRIDDITSFGLDNVGRLPIRTKRRAITDLGGRILVSGILEGAEEGIQYIKGQRYIDNNFDADPNLVKSFIRNIGTGARAVFAAITPWDPVYSNDQEFMENFKGGALLGGLMTTVYGAPSAAIQINNQLPTDQFVSALYAEQMDAKDRVRKNAMYSSFIRTGKYDNLMSSFDEAENIVSRTEGLDIQDIQNERKRAELIRNMYTSPVTMSQAMKAGIDPRTEEYDVFVALKEHHEALLTEAANNRANITSEVDQLMYSPEISQYISSIKPDVTPDQEVAIRNLIRLKSQTELYDQLITDYTSNGNKLSELEKNTGIRTSKSDVIKFKHLLNKDKQQIDAVYQQLRKEAEDLGITEQQLSVPNIHQTLKDLQEKEIIANLDFERAKAERDAMNSPKGAIAKINKWLDVEDQEDTFVQELDDLYSGKKQEDEVIDSEEITPEPVEVTTTPEVTNPEPTIAAESKAQDTAEDVATEPEDITEARQNASAIRNKYFEQERNSKGDVVLVPSTKYKAGKSYADAGQAMKDIYSYLYPNRQNYQEYSASKFMENSEDGLKNLWEDMRDTRMQLEEELYTNGNSSKANRLADTLNSQVELSKFIIQSHSKIAQRIKDQAPARLEEMKQTRQEEQQAAEKLEEIKSEERQKVVKQNDDTPTKSADAIPEVPATPTQEQPTQAELPTLASIMGDWLGAEAASSLQQSQQPQQEQIPVEQPTTVNTQELTYDKDEDPYSHEINYRLSEGSRDANGNYIRISKRYQGMEDYLNDDDLSLVSSKPDFIPEVMNNGVHFEVHDYTNKDGKVEPAIYAIFDYKGKKYAGAIKTVEGGLRGRYSPFNRLPFEKQTKIVDNLVRLRNKIIELYEQTKKNPNLEVVPTALRATTGRFRNEKNPDNSPKNRSLLDSAWLTIKDPFEITPDNTQIGITTGPINNEVIRLRNTILSVKGGSLGQPMWVLKVPRLDGEYDTKLVKLNYQTFADKPQIADLILNLVTSNEQFYTDAKGVKTNIRPIDILDFIVNFGPHTAVNPNDTRFTPQQIQAKQRKQFFVNDNGNLVIGNTSYSISDLVSQPDIRQQAKNYIMSNFHWNIDEQALNTYYLGGDLQSQVTDPRFKSVAAFLKNSNIDKLTIIPGLIELDQSEFGIIPGSNGRKTIDSKHPNGMSTLGWYIKQGILLTDIADELWDSNIYVDDVMLADKAAEKIQQQAQQKVEKEYEDPIKTKVFTLPDESGKQTSVNMADIFAILDGKKRGPNMEVEVQEDNTLWVNERIDPEQAEEWLSSTFGTSPQIIPTIIDVTEAGTAVVGRVIEDSVLISNFAPVGTEYHEAWHRVSLLLIDNKRRERIYNRMRKKNPQMTDSQIEEALADQFRDFMLNEAGSYAFDTKNWFRRILDFIKLWARTGQYALAKIYSDINRGKFYGIKPNEENVNRFRQIYGTSGPNLEVAGYELKTITQYNQFDNIIKSLTYAFFRVNGQTTVPNIEYSALAEDNQQFERLKLIIEAQARTYPSPVMDEILEKYETVFMPTIATRLKQLGIRAIDRNEDETISDIEEGAERVNIGQHTVEGMNISIKDNAPAEVKFFFQTIPLYEISPDGSMSMKIDPITHFANFVDAKTAWDNILKDLSGCRTIANIVDKVATYAQNGSAFHSALLFKLNRLIKDSNQKEDLVKAADAEAMLTKIETVVTCDINNYVTAKISKDPETGFIKHELVDNTVDVKAATYPKVWSQALFTNAGLFKYDKEGVIIAEEGSKKALDTVIKNFNSVITAFRNNKGILKIADRSIDLHETSNQKMLKKYLVNMFNVIGIGIDVPTIDKMLLSGRYGNPKSDAFTLISEFSSSTVNFGGIPKIVSVLEAIKNAINNDSTIKEIKVNEVTVDPTQVWNNIGYVKELANYYAFTHATDNSLSSYGPDGNSYYMVSQNNFAKDRLNEIVSDPTVFQELESVVYNEHSIILQAVRGGNRNLSMETFINFKDTTTGDKGRDYHGITDREDYIAKMTAVFNNRIIFPTVADKKTYHFIKGITLPHEPIRFNNNNGQTFVQYGEQVMDYLLGYCYDELNQIELCLRQIDDDPNHYNPETGLHYNDDGTINNDWIEPSRRIKNFHTPNKYDYKDKDGVKHTVTLEGNGARFLFLTGIYTNKGFVNFNDPTKSAKECLQLAKDYFFNTSPETQKAFLAGLINRRVKKELEYARDLGLITMNDQGNIWSIRNVLLDDNVVTERSARYQSLDSANAEAYAVFDMISDYVINSIISIQEIEKLFSGSPAYYKVKYDREGIIDVSIDKIKRLGSLTSTGLNNRLDFFNDPMRDEYVVTELKDHEIMDKQYHEYEGLFYRANIKETIQEVLGEEVWNEIKDLSIRDIEKQYPEETKIAKQAAKVAVAGYKKGVNVADAAVYISPNMTRDLLRMRGVWNADIKRAFEVLTDPDTADKWESDPKLYAEANKVILNAMKYIAFGTRFRNGLGIPYFNKMALFPLFKSVATGDIKALYDRMVDPNDPIDMAMFDSAVKAGSESPTAYYRKAKDSEIELKDGQTVLSASIVDQAESGQGNTITDLSKLVTYRQKFKYIRQQLETNPHTHPEQMAGTQFLKVNLSNLRMDDLYGPDGSQVTGKDINDTVMGALNTLSDMGRQDIIDELFVDGNVNVTALGNMLERDARESDANDNVLSGLKTKNNAFVIPLSALSDNKWLESRFISMINKLVIDVHMPGGAFIQRSAFGLEATSQNVITEDMINDGKPLLMINDKDGSMDSVVSINLFKHMIPNYSKMTFKQARKWLLDHNIIGQSADATGIGYRIPTQSIASISALRFVDVFPEIMGDTIMLPEGFTKLTGSDFDIDKLYVARYSFNKNGGIITHGDALTREDVASAYKNDIIRMYIKILLTKDNSAMLKGSIDDATDTVKGILKDIEGTSSYHPEPFEVYTPRYQEDRKAEYTGGKAGIGPFALNNAHHILTQLVGIRMQSNEFTGTLQIEDIGRIYDYPTKGNPKGGRILDWLSAMINAFVDIAKDPYIVKLNVNAWTYNMVSFLLRTGKGAQTFYFVRQPILVEMANEVLKTKGKYGIDRTKTPSQLEKEAIEKVLDKYDPTKKLRKKYEYIRKNETKASEYQDLFRTYIDDKGEITSRTRQLLKINPEDSKNFNEEQVRIYYAWLALKPYADDLANLVKFSKIDTKKTGKTFAEQDIYYKGMLDMEENSKFAEGEVTRFFNETFIRTKTENSIPLGSSIFRNLLLRNTDQFANQKHIALSLVGRATNADSKLLSAVINGMEAQIKSQFFNQYVKDNNIDLNTMFQGRNSIPNRLYRFKQEVLKGNPRLSHLLNNDGTIANDFVNYLIPNINKEGLDFIDRSEQLNADQAQANNLINYWRQLLDDPEPSVKRLFRDLAVYSFYTSGDNTVMNAFFQYLPNSERISMGYTQFVQGKLDQMVNNADKSYNDIEDLFLNNWQNDKLVRPVDMYGGKYQAPLRSISLNKDVTMPNIILGQRTDMQATVIKPLNWVTIDDVKYPIFPPYVKIKDNLGFEPANWHVYRLIGYIDKPERTWKGKLTGRTLYTPIYGLISKKGYSYRGHTIIEYGIPTQFEFNKENEWDYFEALNNLDALSDMTDEVERTYFEQDKAYMHHIGELPSYSGMNYAIAEQDRVFEYDQDDADDSSEGVLLEEAEEPQKSTKDIQSSNESNVIIRDKDNPYSKTEPLLQQNRDKAFVFTENAQAYAATHPNMRVESDELLKTASPDTVKLYVSDMRNSDTPNTAGIRSTDGVTQTPNVFGIVVKKYQQLNGKYGSFARQEGQFQDTDGDFELFKQFNEDFFDKLKEFKAKQIVMPGSIALGRAALPYRFAQWLQNKIQSELGIAYDLQQTTTPGYTGFGLKRSVGAVKENSNQYVWDVFSENNYEVSSAGDKRFSALYATFKPGTVIDDVDVSNMSIEDVYQNIIKKSGKGQAPSKDSKLYNPNLTTKEQREDFSYYNGYLPLWQEWARQNTELIAELAKKAAGKTLTDKFANTNVSQARALSDILIQQQVQDVNNISEKTEAFGVELANGSKDFWSKVNDWVKSNPNGIVAYRKYGDKPETFSGSSVNKGWIGNPFSVTTRGSDTVQQFYDWLVTGNNFGEQRATEQFRQAIIQKILNTPENSKVFYYTELNRPSHATVIGYLIRNKQLLNQNISLTKITDNNQQHTKNEKVLTKQDTKKLNFDEVASKVFDLVNKLGIQTVLVDQSQLIQSATIAQFDSDNNRIKLRKDYEDYVKEAGISLNNLLLHEYIHVITSYAIDNADKMSADVQAAVKTIKATYKTLLEKEKDNYVDFMGSILPDSNDYYGLKSEYEMIAELANPNFRKILSKHNLLDKLISNIKDLIFRLFDKFGISHNPTLEDSLVASLDTLIDNFDSMIYNDWNKTRTAQRWFRDNIQRVSINKYIGNKVMDQVNTQLENEPYEEVAELIINIPTDIARDIYNQLGRQNAKNKPFILSFDGGSIMFARLTGLKPSDKKMQGKYTELDTYDMTIETHPEIIPIEEYEKAGNQYRPLADVGSTQALTSIDLVSLYDQGNRRVSEVLDQLSDLTQEERQTYLNEFAQYMRDNNVNTQDKLEEALRKFICNL